MPLTVPTERPFVLEGPRALFGRFVDHANDFVAELSEAREREGKLVCDLSGTSVLIARWVRALRDLHAEGGVTVVGAHDGIRESAKVMGCPLAFAGKPLGF